MIDRPSQAETELATARSELKRVQARTATARSELAKTLVEAQSQDLPVLTSQLSRVMEVNEQLLISSLRLRQTAETVELALKEALRSGDVDALTQLPNRVVLRNRLSHAIAHARRNGSQVALLFIDLDDFKQINDTFGHGVGDDVLKETALRLTATLRAEDTVSRLGGDEFVILLGELSDVADAMTVAEKVIANLGAPWFIRGHGLKLNASIGISLYPADGEDSDTLLDRADAAMYAARRLRVSSFVYDHDFCAPNSAPGPVVKKQTVPAAHVHDIPGGDALRPLRSHLREVNEQLLLSTLSAQHLQAAAELALRKQKDVLAVVAHELRNPLTPMRMAAGMLGRATPERLLELQSIIEGEVTHMTALVGDLLDVARTESGKLRLDMRLVDLAQVARDALDACRPSMDARKQHIHAALPEDGLCMFADSIRLSQVVRNLLDNASKYTPEGGSIEFSLEKIGPGVVLTVADNGIGIRPEVLPHVFDPFIQDTHAVGFNSGGVGIGLTVVRDLVEAHGGTVVAYSQGAGTGSRFVVTLPYSSCTTPETAAPSAADTVV